MIKIMLFMSRKQGMSREDFRRYYEEHHAPLAAANVPHLIGYKRNFVVDRFSDEPDYDCITEFYYDLAGDWRELRKSVMPQSMLDMFAADEANFIDRATMRVVVVEEGVTPPADLQGNSA